MHHINTAKVREVLEDLATDFRDARATEMEPREPLSHAESDYVRDEIEAAIDRWFRDRYGDERNIHIVINGEMS